MASLKQLASKIAGYFNPQINAGQNFWSSPVAQGLARQQTEVAEPFLRGVSPVKIEKLPFIGRNFGTPSTSNISKLSTGAGLLMSFALPGGLQRRITQVPRVASYLANAPRVARTLTTASQFARFPQQAENFREAIAQRAGAGVTGAVWGAVPFTNPLIKKIPVGTQKGFRLPFTGQAPIRTLQKGELLKRAAVVGLAGGAGKLTEQRIKNEFNAGDIAKEAALALPFLAIGGLKAVKGKTPKISGQSIKTFERQLDPSDVARAKTDAAIEGWNDKQYTDHLKDMVDELKSFKSGQLGKIGIAQELQTAIFDFRRTEKEMGAKGLSDYVLKNIKGKSDEEALSLIKQGQRAIRDKNFEGWAKQYLLPKISGQVGKVSQQIKSQLPQEGLRSPLSNIQEILPTRPSAVLSKVPLTPNIPQGVKERGILKTIGASELTSQELKEGIKKIKPTIRFYKPYSDPASLENAQSVIATEGVENAKNTVLNGEYNKTNVAIGETLISKAMNEGRIDEATELLENLSVKATTSGQANQAWSMWSRMTPEGMLKYAVKTILTAKEQMGFATKFIRRTFGKDLDIKLTSEEATQITNLMKKANATADETVKMNFTKQALDIINNKIPYGVSNFLDEFRYNNMLSNPRTSERNIYMNALNTYFSAPTTLVAQGKPVDAVKYYFGSVTGLKQAAIDAWSAFTGKTPILKPDIRELGKTRFPIIAGWPSRGMEAQDRFFQALIKNGMKTAGASNEEAQRLANYFLLRTQPGTKGQGFVSDKIIDEASNWLFKAPKPVRWFVPFIRTPMNAIKMWLDYSPLGIANVPGNIAKREQAAKIMMGSIASFWGATIAADNRTTWSAPTDQTAKQLFYASGRKPFSVRFGDKWVPMWYFGPFTGAIALPAALKHFQDDSRTALTDSGIEKATQVAGGLLNFILGQTPLSGLNTFAQLAQGDIDFSLVRNLGFTSSQLIPFSGLLSWISKIVDPIYRKPDTFMEQIQSGIPGMTQELTPYTEPFGQPSTRQPINQFLPFDIGQTKLEYESMLQQRESKLQSNAMESAAKKDIEKDKSGIQTVGNKFLYWDEESTSVKTIDLDFTNIEKPKG